MPFALSDRRRLIVATALYLCVLTLPSLFISVDGMSKALYFLLIVLALVNNARTLFWGLLPFFILSPSAMYYSLYYRVPTDISLWFLLLGTNTGEMLNFLHRVAWPVFALLTLIYAGVAVFCLRWMRGAYFSGRSKGRMALLLLVLIPLSYAPRNSSARDYALDIYRHFRKAYPENLVLGYMAAQLEVDKLRDLIRQPPDFHPSLEPRAQAQPATYVLVLGESARRDHLGLYGYPEDTTPRLAARDGVLVFRDMVSYGYNTSTAVPYLLTRHNDSQIAPSFLSVFRQAGFKVFWLSNQARYGQFDSLISAYAAAADVVHFSSMHSFATTPVDNYDGKLLPDYRQALADPAPKKLIVLHLYGSHPDFAKRYPPDQAVLASSYDNSIRYTDTVLDQVITGLDTHRTLSALVYISDHGLNLGECAGAEGHIDARVSYEVPFLLWTNPAWRTAMADKHQALAGHQASPAHAGDVFDTLTDLAGIRYPGQQLDRSLASTDYKARPRLVKAAAGELDYDASETGPDCHLARVK